MKIISPILIVLSTCATCLAQQEVALNDLIPQEEQVRLGLGKLDPQQKQALAEKIFDLMAAAYTKGQASCQQDAREPGSKKSIGEPDRGGRVYAGTGSGHWVQTNVDGGEFIVLEDGSLWAIDPLDRIYTTLWLAISSITVVESDKGTPGYSYLLINTDDGEKAHAKYMGKK